MRIPMHELKASLSHCVARAQAGELIEITVDGTPVVHLVGVPPASPAGPSRLLARGAAIWGGGRPTLHAPAVLSPGGKAVSMIVLEDRG